MRSLAAGGCIVALSAAIAGCGSADAIDTLGSTSRLPPGEGRAILDRECLGCHALDALELFSGYYGRAEWRSLILTMRAAGASVDDEQVEVLAAYLARHFGTGD